MKSIGLFFCYVAMIILSLSCLMIHGWVIVGPEVTSKQQQRTTMTTATRRRVVMMARREEVRSSTDHLVRMMMNDDIHVHARVGYIGG